MRGQRPALRAAGSLREQLLIIQKLWAPLIGEELSRLLELAGEILREEELAIWAQFTPPGRRAGQQQWPSPAAGSEVPVFNPFEYERFSADTAWMPEAVMMAKSTYVWLAQLSRQYGRDIRKLDEIPEAELQTLRDRGIDTLWLIGVWERSRASKTIKQLCGNSDAVASAYSLYDYQIAEDLGGEAAYVKLRDRAYHHGVRLASDMVPNHMGIDSPWVIEHPEWFMSRGDSPYPAYSFNGPDLSHDSRVERVRRAESITLSGGCLLKSRPIFICVRALVQKESRLLFAGGPLREGGEPSLCEYKPQHFKEGEEDVCLCI